VINEFRSMNVINSRCFLK